MKVSVIVTFALVHIGILLPTEVPFNNYVVTDDTKRVCLAERQVLTLLVGHRQAKHVFRRT
jgi:hypothetical protein